MRLLTALLNFLPTFKVSIQTEIFDILVVYPKYSESLPSKMEKNKSVLIIDPCTYTVFK